MRSEVAQIIKNMDQNNLETKIALQCAPLLTGIKISNLFIVPTINENQVICMLEGTPISLYTIYKTVGKTIFLLFRKEELEAYLYSKDVNNAMNHLGYCTVNINRVLEQLDIRYTKYCKGSGTFPHELGLLLGYPVEDVIGFIENQGKNYLFAGYWKVYSNLRETLCLFEKYSRAKETVIKMVSLGVGIQNIIEICDLKRS